jgi:hypothetical protein
MLYVVCLDHHDVSHAVACGARCTLHAIWHCAREYGSVAPTVSLLQLGRPAASGLVSPWRGAPPQRWDARMCASVSARTSACLPACLRARCVCNRARGHVGPACLGALAQHGGRQVCARPSGDRENDPRTPYVPARPLAALRAARRLSPAYRRCVSCAGSVGCAGGVRRLDQVRAALRLGGGRAAELRVDTGRRRGRWGQGSVCWGWWGGMRQRLHGGAGSTRRAMAAFGRLVRPP